MDKYKNLTTEEKIDKLLELVEETNYVEIKNGHGRSIRFKRKEFDQTTYDRFRFKGIGGVILKIAGSILLILQIITAVIVVDQFIK